MNAPHPPHDPSQTDELVSAYVDGVAAADEIEIVEASPELMARVESMRSVSAMLGAPVAPPADAVREDHLAAAMGEFDRLFAADAGADATVTPLPQAAAEPAAASAPAAASTSGVTSLAEARERKRPRRLNMVAAAAAAVAILFAGIVAVGINTGGETTDVVAEASSDAAEPAAAIESRSDLVLPETEAASADEDAMADDAMDETAMDEEAMEDEEAAMDEAMADDAMDAMDSAAEAGAAPEPDAEAAFAAPLGDADESAADGADNAAQSRPVGFLGAFTTVEDLAEAATADLAEVPATKTAADRSTFLPPTDCSDIAQELTGLNDATLLSTAFLDDNPVELHATADDQILILSSTNCSVIESIPGS